jgi:DNA ligase-1
MADLADGESTEMRGSGAKPYILQNTRGVYSCSCPAWRNQSVPIEKRTCKHLRKLRGDDAERKRIGDTTTSVPSGFVRKTNSKQGESPRLLLANTWDDSVDPSGWWMSEKLDGVRALWDGERFVSRQGNPFAAPPWFCREMPSAVLDGELWIGRREFQQTVSVVRSRDGNEGWAKVRFLVFDAPALNDVWEIRMAFLQRLLPDESQKGALATAVEHVRCDGAAHLRKQLKKIEKAGGEGLMLREPGSAYEAGRSSTLLKVKSFLDAEATVLEHQPGQGKFRGLMGALVVQLADGTRFSVGTGFSDRERANPPAVGSVITFRYQELSKDGVPRFPSFVRIASDA